MYVSGAKLQRTRIFFAWLVIGSGIGSVDCDANPQYDTGHARRALFSNQFNGRDVFNIQGVPNLARVGNAIIERTITREGFLRYRELTIGRDGSLRGAAERVKTTQNLREFYLKNVNRFGVNLDEVCFNDRGRRVLRGKTELVARFLRANGGCDAAMGAVSIDLSTHGLEYSGLSTTETGRKILNMLINSVSSSTALFSQDRVRADGTVTITNLNRFLRSDALSLALSNNPFSKCGRPIPLQWLVERLMNPEIYYRLLAIPERLGDLGERLGVFTDKTQTRGNKILVYRPPGQPKESVPGEADQRILERQTQVGDVSGRRDTVLLGRRGGAFYASWDFISDPAPGLDQEARDVFRSGIKVTHDASEMLWQLPNGFMAGALYNSDGNRQNAAPKNIAQGGILSTISPMGACLDCHRDGFNGGGIILNSKPPRSYINVFSAASPHPRIDPFSRQFFARGGNPEYDLAKRQDSRDVISRQIQADARIVLDGKTQAGITDIMFKYRAPVTPRDQERELHLASGSRSQFGTLSRRAFDQAFCALAKGGATRGSVEPRRAFEFNDSAIRRDGTTHGTQPRR